MDEQAIRQLDSIERRLEDLETRKTPSIIRYVSPPTGVAATDTANLQAAINSAIAAGGGMLRFQAGTYIINTSINVTNTSYLTILGTGMDVTNIYCNVNGKPCFDFTGSRFITIQDLTIEGDGTTIPSTAFLFARSNTLGSWQIRMINVHTHGSYSITALYNWSSELNYFDNCFFENEALTCKGAIFTGARNKYSITSDYVAFAATVSNATGLFINCTFELFGATTPPDGIVILGSECGDWNFTHCYMASDQVCPSWLMEGMQYSPVFDSCLVEHSANTYHWHHIAYSGAGTISNWSIRSTGGVYGTKAIKCDSGTTVNGISIKDSQFIILAGTSSDIEFYDLTYAHIEKWWQNDAGTIVIHNLDYSYIEYYNHARTITNDRYSNIWRNMVPNSEYIEFIGPGAGIVLASPDGTRYKVSVANGGTIAVGAA